MRESSVALRDCCRPKPQNLLALAGRGGNLRFGRDHAGEEERRHVRVRRAQRRSGPGVLYGTGLSSKDRPTIVPLLLCELDKLS